MAGARDTRIVNTIAIIIIIIMSGYIIVIDCMVHFFSL